MFGSYSKLIAAVLGNVIAIVVAYLAGKGLATCTPGPLPTDEQTCTVLGYTTGQITTALMVIVNAGFVYFFPANKPAA